MSGVRHALYVAIAIVSAVAAWWHGIAWVQEGGDLVNLPSFFLDAYHSGNAAAFLTIDILAAWAVFLLWVVPDARRIGLGTRTGWLYFGLSFVAPCFAFPLYLVVPARHFARPAGAIGLPQAPAPPPPLPV